MKNYKNVAPLILIAVMGLSVYSLIGNTMQEKNNYNKYLLQAQEYRQDGIVEDAVEEYKKALAIHNDIGIALEIGAMYVENDYLNEALKWGETLVEEFPKTPQAYTFLLQQYNSHKKYKECFTLNDKAENKKVSNEEFKNLIQEINYQFEISFSEYEEVSTFSNGYCAISINKKWGYVNDSGATTVPCIYTQAGPYFDEFAAVQEEKEWYYINTKGKKKKAIKNLQACSYLGPIYDDVLVACDGKDYAYYNKDFEKLGETYTYASTLNGDIGAVQKENKWSLVNSVGEVLTANEYDEFVLDEKNIAYRNNRAFGKRDGLYYMIDEKGQEIKTEQLKEAKLFLPEGNYTAVNVGTKWGFMDNTGNMVIEPQYQDARPFSHELAAVKQNGKWGFIDIEGNIAIEPQFTDAKDFNTSGCVFVSQGAGWSLLKLYKDNH